MWAGEGGGGWSGHHQLPSTLCSVARRGERVTGELKKCQKCTGTQQRPTVLCWSRHPHTSTSTCRTLALVTWASLFSSSPPRCCSPDPGHWELCNCTTHDVISRLQINTDCVHTNILTSSTSPRCPAVPLSPLSRPSIYMCGCGGWGLVAGAWCLVTLFAAQRPNCRKTWSWKLRWILAYLLTCTVQHSTAQYRGQRQHINCG